MKQWQRLRNACSVFPSICSCVSVRWLARDSRGFRRVCITAPTICNSRTRLPRVNDYETAAPAQLALLRKLAKVTTCIYAPLVRVISMFVHALTQARMDFSYGRYLSPRPRSWYMRRRACLYAHCGYAFTRSQLQYKHRHVTSH